MTEQYYRDEHLQGEVYAGSEAEIVNFEELSEKAEEVEQADLAAQQAEIIENNADVVADFRAKTEELFHSLDGEAVAKLIAAFPDREVNDRESKEYLAKIAEYKPLAKIEELEEQNYNMIDNVLNNGVEKFNREEEKKAQQEKPQARSSLKERLAAKQKEAAQGNNKDTKEQEKSKNSHREM